MAIQGNEGVGVYLRDSGYVVEHFRLEPNQDYARVLYRSHAFDTREEASDHAWQYRIKQERN